MPSNVVRTAREEHLWEQAKKIAEKAGRSKDYAYIMGVYQRSRGEKSMIALLAGGRDQLAKARRKKPDPNQTTFDFSASPKPEKKAPEKTPEKTPEKEQGSSSGGARPPAGYQPIPKSSKGGYFKMVGGKRVYWYPSKGGAGRRADHSAMAKRHWKAAMSAPKGSDLAYAHSQASAAHETAAMASGTRDADRLSERAHKLSDVADSTKPPSQEKDTDRIVPGGPTIGAIKEIAKDHGDRVARNKYLIDRLSKLDREPEVMSEHIDQLKKLNSEHGRVQELISGAISADVSERRGPLTEAAGISRDSVESEKLLIPKVERLLDQYERMYLTDTSKVDRVPELDGLKRPDYLFDPGPLKNDKIPTGSVGAIINPMLSGLDKLDRMISGSRTAYEVERRSKQLRRAIKDLKDNTEEHLRGRQRGWEIYKRPVIDAANTLIKVIEAAQGKAEKSLDVIGEFELLQKAARGEVIGHTADGKEVYGSGDTLEKDDSKPSKKLKKKLKKKAAEKDDAEGEGSRAYHAERALAHLHAAQAHAGASRSAESVDKAKGHKDAVAEAKRLSELAVGLNKALKKGGGKMIGHTSRTIQRNGMVVDLDYDQAIVESLEKSDSLTLPPDAVSPDGRARLLGMRGERLEKATIIQGEHSGPRIGDRREDFVRARMLLDAVELDGAGVDGNGGLPEWFRDAWKALPPEQQAQVRQDLRASKAYAAGVITQILNDDLQVIDDSDPYHRNVLNPGSMADRQNGLSLLFQGGGRDLPR